jgi:uncharacterized protein (DUF1697 family)
LRIAIPPEEEPVVLETAHVQGTHRCSKHGPPVLREWHVDTSLFCAGSTSGAKNLIAMPDLKRCFEEHGFLSVVTYIQSGNVIFESEKTPAAELTQRIEAMLGAAFDYGATVVLWSHAQLRRIVERAPDAFGAQPARCRYDVLFLRPHLTAHVAVKSIPTRAGVDQAYAGTGVLYFSRLISKASQSRLS